MGEATAGLPLHWSWRAVLTGAGGLLALLLLATGLLAGDKEAVAIGAAAALGIAATRWRGGAIGTVVVALIGADTAFWLVPAAIDNARHHDGAAAVALPLVLGVAALTATGAAIGHLQAARRQHVVAGRGPVVLAGIAVLVVAASLVTALATGDAGDRLPPGGVALSAGNMEFSATTVTATLAPASPSGTTVPSGTTPTATGQVTVAFTNHDLFWHTFTIDGLGVDLRAPVGGRRQTTFTAAPGTYRFYCAIPGHESAGMEGTLVVTAG